MSRANNDASMKPSSHPPTSIYDPSELASVLNNVAALYHERGEHVCALRHYQESLHTRMEMLHRPHRNTGIAGQDCGLKRFDTMVAQEEKMSNERQQITKPKCNGMSLVLFPFLATARRNSVVTGLSSSSVDEFVTPTYSLPLHLPHSKNKIVPASSLAHATTQQENELSAATSLYNMGLVHHENGTFEKAHELFRMALSVLSRRDHGGLVSLILLNVAQVHCRRNETDAALGVLAEAYGLLQDALSVLPPTQTSGTRELSELPELPRNTVDMNECLSLTLSLMGQIYYFKGDIPNAFATIAQSLDWYSRNIRRKSSVPNENDEEDQSTVDEAICRYNLGLVHHLRGEVEDAIKHVEYFVSTASAFYGIDLNALLHKTPVSHELSALALVATSQVAEALQTLGSLYVEDASVSSALRSFEVSLTLHRMNQGLSSPAVADTLFRIGQIFHHTGQTCAAMRYHRQSLHIYQKHLKNPNFEDMAMIMSNMGMIHHSQGELDESISMYEEVLRMSRLAFGNEDGCIVDLLCIIGNLYLEIGDNSKAHSHFVEATTILTQMRHLQVQQMLSVNSNDDTQNATHSNQLSSLQPSASDVLVIVPSLTHGFGIEWYPCAAAA